MNVKGLLLQNERLSRYTSWRVGGIADYVYFPENLADLSEFLKQLPEETPLLWLGLGSNTLVRDKGVQGVVIVTQGALNAVSTMNENVIRAEAGVACAQVARYTARLGFTGLEFMAGIPGTVGGALAMNAGCYGGETWQYVRSVEMINRKGKMSTRLLDQFKVQYRHVEKPTQEWFVAGHFYLQPGNKKESLEKIRSLLHKRNVSQPTGTANCGSVFRNPPGKFAAQLIEQAGLKGKRIGGASVSLKHANFIINEGTATASDIEQLIEELIKLVNEKTGITLVKEVCIVGR